MAPRLLIQIAEVERSVRSFPAPAERHSVRPSPIVPIRKIWLTPLGARIGKSLAHGNYRALIATIQNSNGGMASTAAAPGTFSYIVGIDEVKVYIDNTRLG
ncbi:hypothetical protein RRG08_046054 [Elysia crispata]|uniref:Uncharacterized protein n=1 Tax=Elysia crispata TaxID=231223 RepID=A0AAE1A958_9GAST|nr:hypothetical protein RRG08_046054 [Elysia crispata]